jgi:hypothetical protein
VARASGTHDHPQRQGDHEQIEDEFRNERKERLGCNIRSTQGKPQQKRRHNSDTYDVTHEQRKGRLCEIADCQLIRCEQEQTHQHG